MAAPVESDTKLPISAPEAELLGWILGDGCVYYGKNNRGGKYGKLNVTVTQNKPRWLDSLRDLLSEFPHSVYETNGNHWSARPGFVFRIHSLYARDLFKRSGFERDLSVMVLSMSDEQRAAFIEGLLRADGHQPKNSSRMLAQNEGAGLDAASLAIYMEGFYGHRTDSGGQKHVSLSRPWLKGGEFKVEELDAQPVWCVTTELGTWTMRQDNQVMLTGNSRYGSPAAAWGHETAIGWYHGGGPVTGYGPHVPTVLQPREFVQPVAAVDHYGTDFMRAVQTRTLPKSTTVAYDPAMRQAISGLGDRIAHLESALVGRGVRVANMAEMGHQAGAIARQQIDNREVYNGSAARMG